MRNIQSIATSISAYIDIHEKMKLTESQRDIILEAREVILKSLEIATSDVNLSEKKIKKIEEKLDTVFNKVISIFSESGSYSPEIIETKLTEVKNEKRKKPEKKKKVKSKKKKKIKSEEPDVDLEPTGELGEEVTLNILQKFDDDIKKLKKQFQSQNMALLASMAIMEEITKKMRDFEKQLEKLKK
jgi:hypothetical protein